MLPFFHIYGLVVLMNIPLYRGATVVTMPRFDLAEFLRVIQDYRITRAWVVPPIVLALAKHPLVDEYDLSSLEYVNSGAAPLSAELEVACGERLGCHMQQGYGLTETSPVTHWVTRQARGHDAGLDRPRRSRTPSAGSSTSRPSRTSPAGEPGELCIRGPQVMKGYLNNPEATAHAIDADGWFHTGDVARLDEDGSLLDRRPDQGADQVQGLPDRPGRARGAAPHPPGDRRRRRDPAPLTRRPARSRRRSSSPSGSITADEVIAFVAERVAPYKKLRAVEIVDEIPKSPSGKILRRRADRPRARARRRDGRLGSCRKLSEVGAAGRPRRCRRDR